jgi:2-oxoglutarate dehydrogenase E1 component
MNQDFGVNQAFVEELFLRFQENPSTVGEGWRVYFEGLQNESGHVVPGTHDVDARAGNGNGASNGNGAARAPAVAMVSLSPGGGIDAELAQRVNQLIHAYRLRGHLWAGLDPLGLAKLPPRELTPERFGISAAELDARVPTGDLRGLGPEATVRAIIERLEETYCRSIGVEFMHIEELHMRAWLRERMESAANRLDLAAEEQLHILGRLIDAEIFEQFLHTNFIGAKRFSLEGGESLIPLLDLMLERAGELGVEETVIGMAHRGRLNVLCNIMQKSPKDIFAHFFDKHPEHSMGRGDVKYHLGYSCERPTATGGMHLSLAFNPSHLEFVNPVVTGRVRAKQDRRDDAERKRVVPLLIHGDAAFIGQGVVAETLNLMSLRGYATGGTLHVVVNNQVGFTTNTVDARSTRYATDLAKMLGIPIFHVNGEDPEAVAHVAHLAVEYRQEFGRDVVIDMYCYRKWGHNETDEPRFTQPVMYATIDRKPSVRAAYVERLLQLGKVTQEQVDALAAARKGSLEDELTETRVSLHHPAQTGLAGLWARYHGGPDAGEPEAETRVDAERLRALMGAITTVPDGFHINAKVQGLLKSRREQLADKLDWGTAEALAFASLLDDGVPIRLSGQDAGRGTFSHRHAVWTDSVSGARYSPLSSTARGRARFEVIDSPLSETGVLGFDYGYSLDYPDGLVIWEAQFGDFANGGQVIIDQFLSSGEDKWNRLSGLTLLLPHGFEGAGPEHSSGRVERFLQLCAEDNLFVCNLTTPAQIFHALRRQVLRSIRKPLVIMTPKSFLRVKESSIEDLSEGRFQRVIPDAAVDPAAVRKVLLCSGKVYWDLFHAREKRGAMDVAIVRLEQLYPLSQVDLAAALAPYADRTPLVWVQEDPWNMGGWYFIAARLPALLGGRLPLSCVAREESASPATGSKASHDLEQAALLDEALR